MDYLQTLITNLSELHYLVKASLILSFLYLLYHVYFSKDTSFAANRLYLLGTVAWTICIPLIGIDVFPVWFHPATPASKATDVPMIDSTSFRHFSLVFILQIIYLSGLICMLTKMVLQLLNIVNIIKHSEIIVMDTYNLIVGAPLPVSSFLNYIFLPQHTTEKMLIDHEIIHVRQKHSFDLFIAEIFKCVFWFHPFAYGLVRSIRLNHEYECDAKMATQYSYAMYGSVLLDQAQSQTKHIFINQFYSFTKKRIAMMLHQKNNPRHSYRYLLMIPAFFVLFTFFSFRSYYVPMTNPESASISVTDTVPSGKVKMDTIITLDPVNFQETKQIVVRKMDIEPLDEVKVIQMNPEVITFSDTIFTFDPNTFIEKVEVNNGKMVKGYKILIEHERRKASPDFKQIEKWQKAGKRE